MRAIFTVFGKEFRESLRDRRTLWSALGFGAVFSPLLFAAILSLTIHRNDPQNDQALQLAVAHSERAPNLVGHLVEYGVTVEPVGYDDAAARKAVQEHRHRLVLMIPANFGERFIAGQPAPLELYSDASDQTADRDVRRAKGILASYGAVITQLRLMARGMDPTMLAPIAVHDVDVSTPASRSVIALGTMSYMILITMLMGGMYLAIDATAGERERGSLEPLLTVPVRRDHLIYGKILAACAFMTIIAAYTRSYREAQTYLGLVLLAPTLPLVFASALGLRPTPLLMATPSMSQHFLITSLLRDEAIPLVNVVLSVGVTLGLGLVLAAIAGRLYQREALLG